jgi:hypothetical protein
MGIIDLGNRVSRNAWRLPLLGQVLALDYARSFSRRPPNRFRGVYASFAEHRRIQRVLLRGRFIATGVMLNLKPESEWPG